MRGSIDSAVPTRISPRSYSKGHARQGSIMTNGSLDLGPNGQWMQRACADGAKMFDTGTFTQRLWRWVLLLGTVRRIYPAFIP